MAIGATLIASGIYNGRLSGDQFIDIYQGNLSVKAALFPENKDRTAAWTFLEDPLHQRSTGHCGKTRSLLFFLGDELVDIEPTAPLKEQFTTNNLSKLDPELSNFFEIAISLRTNEPYWQPKHIEKNCQQTLSSLSTDVFNAIKGLSKFEFVQYLDPKSIRLVDGSISYQRFLFIFDQEERLVNFAIRTTDEMIAEQRVDINI